MAKRFELAKHYTEKYKDILKPCKYCGNKNIIITSELSIYERGNFWSVTCATPKCDCTGSYRSVKDAIKAWNRRVQNDL